MGALDTGRGGGITDWRPSRVPERTLVNYDIGDEGLRGVSSAALTIAIPGLERRAPIFEPDVAAEAAPCSHFARRCAHRPLHSMAQDCQRVARRSTYDDLCRHGRRTLMR